MTTSTRVSLWNMDCRARCFAVFLCLTDEDLQSLGAWTDQSSPDGLSPQAWSRSYLQVECGKDGPLARSVQDALDLKFCSEIEATRHLPCARLSEALQQTTQRDARHTPGLLWALATDQRPEAQRLAAVISLEVLAQGCGRLRTCEGTNGIAGE